MRSRLLVLHCLASAMVPALALGQAADPLVAPYPAQDCSSCAGWNEPQSPVQIHANSYYVGTRGLGAVLIASPEGHVLIDGGLPNSAPLILENIRALGFDVADVRLILNSHAHFDHAGGIAALQRASGARVAAGPASAPVLKRGASDPGDPQFGVLLGFPAAASVETFAFGDTLRIGPIVLVPYETAGHTPGGTTWSWRSCDVDGCVDLVYADSQTPVSADGFRFTDSGVYPSVVEDFRRGFAALERMPCDLLITPHPGASSFWERIAGGREGLIDPEACRRYAAAGRQQLERRLEREAEQRR